MVAYNIVEEKHTQATTSRNTPVKSMAGHRTPCYL